MNTNRTWSILGFTGIVGGILWISFITSSPGLASSLLAALPSTPIWGMFQHDQQHSGRSPYVGPQYAGLDWSFPLPGVPGSPAIGADGTIYVPVGMLHVDTAGYLHAINPDGTEKWHTQLKILPGSTAPAIGPDGTIYIHGSGTEGNIAAIEKMYAINPDDGSVQWIFLPNGESASFSSYVSSSPAVIDDGTIYVGSMNTYLFALNPDSTIKWAKSPTVSGISSSPAVGLDGTVYIHDQFGIYAYMPDGTLKWRYGIGVSGADGSPTIGSDGKIYFSHSGNNRFYALNTDGTKAFSYVLGWPSDSTPALANDETIYIGADGLYAFNPDGTLKWRRYASTLFSSVSPLVGADGTIYWRESLSFYAVNPDGTRKWSMSVEPYAGGLDASFAIDSSGVLYLPYSSWIGGKNSLRAYRSQVMAKSFRSAGAQDGWVLESSETSNKGGTMNAAATVFHLGDDTQDRQYRAILSFDTSGLHDNAVITKVTLRIKKQGLVGTNPFTTHNNILVDIRKGAFGNNNTLQLTDFQDAASKSAAGTIQNTPASGWYPSILSYSAFTYINKTGVTQFRLRFQKDDNDDLGADYLKFYSGNAVTASYQPLLVIEYYVP